MGVGLFRFKKNIQLSHISSLTGTGDGVEVETEGGYRHNPFEPLRCRPSSPGLY